MTTKCIVAGCQNHKDEGRFVGDLCAPCYNMITTGEIKYGTTFIHKLASRSNLLELAKKLVEVMCCNQSHGDDPYAATRRAIVRAAAKIGRATE